MKLENGAYFVNNSHNFLTDNFNSLTIRGHYYNRRQQAVAFLMTIGAKALVLEDQKLNSFHSIGNHANILHLSRSSACTTRDDRSSSKLDDEEDSIIDELSSEISGTTPLKALLDHEGINNEAELRHQMINDEKVRSIRRKIMSKIEIFVWKKGRNDHVRLIGMVLCHDKVKGTFIMWRSRLNYMKKFEVRSTTTLSRVLMDTRSVSKVERKSRKNNDLPPIIPLNPTDNAVGTSCDTIIGPKHDGFPSAEFDLQTPGSTKRPNGMRGIDISSYSAAATNRQRVDSLSRESTDGGYKNSSFMRLINDTRHLDLSFRSSLELEAFLLVLQRQVGLDISSVLIDIT